MARLFGTRSNNDVDPSDRGLDRVTNFSDAVVAIAITLVALPLVDLAQALVVPHGGRPGAWFLQAYGGQIAAAALSFVVIAGFWREQHAEWERADRYTRLLVGLNLLWLATIVFLPVPTVLLFRGSAFDPVTDALYIGDMLLNLLASRAMQIEIAAHCGEPGQLQRGKSRLVLEWIPVVLMAGALVLAVSFPGVSTKALFVLLLSFPLTALLQRGRHRSGAVKAS